MAKRKFSCVTLEDAVNFFENDGSNYDSSDDECQLINIPPENDVSEGEEEANDKITQEASVQNILGRVEVQLHVHGDKSEQTNLSTEVNCKQVQQSDGHAIPQPSQNKDQLSYQGHIWDQIVQEQMRTQLMHNLQQQNDITPNQMEHLAYPQPSLEDNKHISMHSEEGHSKVNSNNRDIQMSYYDNSGQSSRQDPRHYHSLFSGDEEGLLQSKRICIEPDWRLERPVYSKWNSLQPGGKNLQAQVVKELSELSPVEIFEKLFSDEILKFIQVQTLTYAITVKKDNVFTFDDHEFKAFIGFLLYNSYVVMPTERMYWSTESTVGQKLVKDALSRNTYRKVKSYLQMYDRTISSKERGFKIKPFIAMLNKTFQRFGVFDKTLTVGRLIVSPGDEEKFFLKRKPKKCGYKLWAMCGEEGYCYKFDLYCGEDQLRDNSKNDDAGFGADIVENMASALPNPTDHYLYFDKFFTSRELLQNLREKGIRATGGVKDNRLLNCTIKPIHILSNENPGAFDHRFDKNAELLTVRWHGNKDVSIMSNYDDIKPTCIAKYYNVSEKLKTSVTQPKAVKDYVNGSRGVGLFDWLLAKHDIKIRGKKWYWCLFTKILDMIVVNSWILHKTTSKSNRTLSILDFRREIAESYLKAACALQKGAGPPKNAGAHLSKQLPSSLRFDGLHHYIAKNETGRRCRCQFLGCTRKTVNCCIKCNVAVCMECFALFHTKE